MSELPNMTKEVRHTKLRRFAGNMFVLAFTCTVCGLLLEGFIRWQFPFFRPSAQVLFRLTTNGVALGFENQTMRMQTPKGDYNLAVQFNPDGFRDEKDFRTAMPADWFAVGDSYTMGWGVAESERFSTCLQTLLRTNGTGPRVFNIAIPENIIGYQRLVRHVEGLGARVPRLIIGVCMENDLRDYGDGKSAWDDSARPTSVRLQQESLRKWFKQHSALYIATSATLQQVPVLRRGLESLGVAHNIQVLTGANTWDEAVLNSSRDELAKLAAGRDAVVLLIPSRNLWQRRHLATETRIHETFVRLLREAGLTVVDMKPVQDRLTDPMSCYFTTDPHWNAKGHALAAAELATFLSVRPPPAAAPTAP